MSAHTEVEISCDGIPQYGCATPPVFDRNATEARKAARDAGWLVSQPGGKDYCPRHRDPANRES